MSEQASDGGLAAYWRFFEFFNTRDSEKFTDALQFPHLRVSARGPAPRIIPKPEDHAEGMNYERILATGWDHTVGAEPEVLHVSADKVHIKGGWTRYNGDDQPILTNFVTYITTRVADRWRIQSRFGVDPGPDGETPATASTAVAVVEGALNAMASGDQGGAREFFNYPHFNIDPGEVQTFATAAELETNLPQGGVEPGEVRALQSGPNSVSVTFDGKLNGRDMHGVLLVTERDGHWGIESRSIIVD
jgi:hypothetical protein|tara:strand:+ start:15517 stop:16257 length:741 start_codon:yes stop_codon:yes gene_type:complete